LTYKNTFKYTPQTQKAALNNHADQLDNMPMGTRAINSEITSFQSGREALRDFLCQ